MVMQLISPFIIRICKKQVSHDAANKNKCNLVYGYRTCSTLHLVHICVSDLEHLKGAMSEPRHEKTNILHMRKQRRRSASQ